MHCTTHKHLENRDVLIIEVRIKEVGLYNVISMHNVSGTSKFRVIIQSHC